MDNFTLQADSTALITTLNQITTGFVEQITHIPHTSFVTDFTFIMIIGAIVTLAFFKIKQPLIIGYLFAGMLLGPLSPLWSWILPPGNHTSDTLGIGILTDLSALNLFSEIGVILLLFVIGIEFPYAKIKNVGRMAIGVGTIGLFTTLGAIFYAAISFGLNSMDSLFIAAALSISSTAVIVKILEEMGRIKKRIDHFCIGNIDCRRCGCSHFNFLSTINCSGWNCISRIYFDYTRCCNRFDCWHIHHWNQNYHAIN